VVHGAVPQPAWDRLRRCRPAISLSPSTWIRQYAIAALVAACGIPLSLAALGMLLAYDTRMTVARILTLEQVDITVAAGTFCLSILLLAGPSLVCLSLAILAAGRAWLGRTGGTLVWAAGLLVLNSGPLWNGNERFGLSLGLLAEKLRGRMNLVNFDPAQGMYVSDLVIEALVLPLAALGACIVLLAWTSMRPRPQRLSQRLRDGWLAALVALGAVGLAAWLGVGKWTSDPAITSPGSWAGLLYLGATTLIIASVMFNWSGAGQGLVAQGGSQLAWTLGLIPAWGVYTLPNLFAGQVSQREVLSLLAVLLVVCAMFSVVNVAVSRSQPAGQASGQAVYLVVLALAAIPIDPVRGRRAVTGASGTLE
jgi:hypothetical protein